MSRRAIVVVATWVVVTQAGCLKHATTSPGESAGPVPEEGAGPPGATADLAGTADVAGDGVDAGIIDAGLPVDFGVGPKPATCGNNVTDPGEACDGTDLNGFATVDQLVAGYKSGALHCRSDCLGYDVSSGVAGATVNAASCNAADVQTALKNAAHGDTVKIPAGTCTWSTQVTLDAMARSIALRGAGPTQTLITVAVATPIKISTAQGYTFALSGIGLTGGSGSVIAIGGSARSWRVSNLTATNLASGPLISVGGATYGVIDHVTFTGGNQVNFASVADTNWTSWQQPLTLGRATAVIFEDDTVKFTDQHDDVRVIDSHSGGRVVLRHSAINNFVLGADGSYSSSAGSLQFEIYDNQIAITNPTNTWASPLWPTLVSITGGTSVWFDNTFTIDKAIFIGGGMQIAPMRAASGFGSYWGSCDGTARGICSNVDKSWTTLSGGGAKPCVADVDCGTGLTCKWKLCSGSKMNLCAADADCPMKETCSGHLDGPAATSGYPCFMQPGFATEMQGAPVQLSNNKLVGSSNLPAGLVPLSANNNHLMAGRDYVTTLDPKYVPYVYPHPLVPLGP
jgi:hypothetical protein